MDVQSAVRTGALFGISQNNIRVTLNRLVASNLLNKAQRGCYTLGAEGVAFAQQVNHWREAESLLCPWQGDWVCVNTSELKKSDRKAFRARERALSLVGMQQLSADLYIRPNNIRNGVSAVRSQLHSIGLEKTALVFALSQLDDEHEGQAKRLWNTSQLEQSYRESAAALETSLSQLPKLPLNDAAKASYLVGDRALRQLVFDPLLPAPLIEEQLRRDFTEIVKAYDKVGEDIWFKFLRLDGECKTG